MGVGYVKREFAVIGVQTPHPPTVIGGMSNAGYRRAIGHGDGWYGFNQTEEEVASSIEGLRTAATATDHLDRFKDLEISATPRGPSSADRLARFTKLGVSRLILLPQPPSDATSAVDGVRKFIESTALDLKL